MTSHSAIPVLDASSLAARWGLPAVHGFGTVPSTMDIAHAMAADGAPAGTLILADEQSRGRGRSGGRWVAPAGGAVLCTLIERPPASPALEVLSLRIGLALAVRLEPLARSALRVKWPNDVFDDQGKVAGVLIESRWRDQRPDWVAIGVGINLVAPPADAQLLARPSAVRDGTSVVDVLDAILPALRRVARADAPLAPSELDAWHARDLARGRTVIAPALGEVAGIAASGDLLIDTAAGRVACRSGSIVFQES